MRLNGWSYLFRKILNHCCYPFVHLFGRQQSSILNSKLFILSNSRGFLYSKGNSIRFSFSWRFRFAQLSHFCHRVPLFVGMYFKGIALQMSRYLSFLSVSLHKNWRTRCQNKTFHAIVKLFPTWTLWDSMTSKHSFCSLLRFHQAVNETLSTNPESDLEPWDQ